jgi:signal peptide peptidase SppA
MRIRTARHVIEGITESQWAITKPALENILTIAKRENIDPAVVAAELGRPLDNTRDVTIRDGIATIPVTGPLFRYGNLFTRISGATSYEDLSTDLAAALKSPEVRAIVLSIDSPGGQVNGCQELAQLIYEARATKPIIGHIGGVGASGAYWLAAACSEIRAGQTAIAGSVGVIMTFTDTSGADEQAGIKHIEIVSAQSKRKNADPAQASGRAQYQAIADQICDVFVASLAEYRGISVEDVLSNYGQGAVMVAAAALEAGLIDGICTYEELHAELVARSQAPNGFPLPGMSPNAEATVADSKKPDEQPAGAQVPARLTRAQIEEQYPEVAAAIGTDAVAKATPAIATAERERILAIQKHGNLGNAKLIGECIADASCTPGMAAERILAAHAAKGKQRLDAQLEDEEELDAPAPAAPGEGEGSSDARWAAGFVANLDRAKGRKPTAPAGRV